MSDRRFEELRASPELRAAETDRLTAVAARAAADCERAAVSCEPADRAAVQRAVLAAYRLAGLMPPQRVVWLASPCGGALAATLLSTGDPGPGPGAAAVAASLAAQGCAPGTVAPGHGLHHELEDRPWSEATYRARVALGAPGWQRVQAATVRRAGVPTAAGIGALLDARLREALPAAAAPALRDACARLYHPARAAMYEVLAELDVAEADRFALLGEITRAAGYWWAYERVVILTERPVELHRDATGRLHRADGPALRYRDGFCVRAWHGTPIPP